MTPKEELSFSIKSLKAIVSDEALKNAYRNANFGDEAPREVIKDTLLKCACGYSVGRTAKEICYELTLTTGGGQGSLWRLNKLGMQYLWHAIRIQELSVLVKEEAK